MADEDNETYQPAKTPEELDRKTDVHKLRASGAVSSDEMEVLIDPTSCKSGYMPCDGKKHSVYVEIKADSCNDGYLNCRYPGYHGTSIIGANSCNGGWYTCLLTGSRSKSTIGNNSCNSKGETSSSYTCAYTGQTEGRAAIIGNNACNAPGACQMNKGTIADGCCNYKNACMYNKGEIKLGSKECGATAAPTFAPTPRPTSCIKTCKKRWTLCKRRPNCPPGWRKIREHNKKCSTGKRNFLCQKCQGCE